MKTTITTFKLVLFDWVDNRYMVAPDQAMLGSFLGNEYVDPVDASRALQRAVDDTGIPESRLGVQAVDHEVLLRAITFDVTSATIKKYAVIIVDDGTIYSTLVVSDGKSPGWILRDMLPPWLFYEDLLKCQRVLDAIEQARLDATPSPDLTAAPGLSE